MPRLNSGARERDIEADFDDAVVRSEHRLAHRHEPRMRCDIDESAHALGMNLDIETLGAAGQRTARHGPRFREERLDVFAHPRDPRAIERALEADDAVAV